MKRPAGRTSETLKITKLFLFMSAGALACAVPACAGEDDLGEDLSGENEDALVQSTVFQNGVSPSASYAGTTDALIQESTPTTNAGEGLSLQVDRDYPTNTRKSVESVLRFDLSSIPRGSKVSSVRLTVNVTNSTGGGGYNLYALSRAWNESSVTWNAAASGSAWGTPGARATSDRGSAVLGNINPSANGKATITLTAAGVAAVQSWIDDPTKNFGVVFDHVDNMDGLAFDASEVSVAGNRPALSVTYDAPAQAGSGTGLLGEYFSGTAFGSKLLSRTDGTVNFDWGSAAPASGVPADGYSVRWSGQVQPLFDETYTFFTTSDDGVRVTVNGTRIIDNWTSHAATENSGSIALRAGQKYAIVVEYFENTGNAVAKLSWSSPSQPKVIVPKTQLYPATSGATPDAGAPVDSGAPPSTYGAGNAPIGTACVNPKVRVNASMTTPQIQSAIAGAGTGAYVCFESGTYRLTDKLQALAGQTLHGSPNTILDGSVVLGGAAASGSNWVFSSVPLQTTGPIEKSKKWCEDLVNFPCAYVEDVFFDGQPLTRATTLAGVKAGTFYTDYAAKKVYVGTNPAGHTVEIGKTPFAFLIGFENVTIEGFVVRKFAPSMDQGAISFGAKGGKVRNVEVLHSHAAGVAFWGIDDASVTYSRLHDNGQTGASLGGNRGVVDHNDLIHNNIFGYWRNDGASGGVKVDLANDSVVTNNLVNDNLSFGIYYDENADRGLIDKNWVEGNWAAGINFVFSRWGKISNNVVRDNGLDYYKGRDSSACADATRASCLNAGIDLANASDTEVFGNTVVGNANAIILTEYNRDQSTVSWVVPDTKNNRVHDNVITVGGHSTGARQYGGPPGYDITKSNNLFSNNTYHLVSLTGSYFWWNTLMTRSQWQAAGQDTTGTFLSP